MKKKNDKAKKTAGNNQWTSGQKPRKDERERRDGPGGD